MVESAHPFWNWSLKVYARPGAEGILLDLQDRLGLDVNLLLFACWIAATGGAPLREEECRRLMAATRDWRGNVVEPLRAIRRHLKGRDRMAGAEAIRKKVKTLELEAEYAAQLAIAGLMEDRGQFGGPAEGAVHSALAGLKACLAAADIVPGGKDIGLLASLAGICCEGAGDG